MGLHSYPNPWSDFFFRLALSPASNHGSSAIKIFRYLLVGGIAWIADYGLLLALNIGLDANIVVAATAGFVVGLALNYWMALKWVFGQTAFTTSTFMVFLTTGLIGLVINDLSLWALDSFTEITLTVSKLLTTVVVLAWNYFGRLGLLSMLSSSHSAKRLPQE